MRSGQRPKCSRQSIISSYEVCEGTTRAGGRREVTPPSRCEPSLAKGTSTGVSVASASLTASRACAREMTCISMHAASHMRNETPVSVTMPSSTPACMKPFGTPRKPLPMITLIEKHTICQDGRSGRWASSKTNVEGESAGLSMDGQTDGEPTQAERRLPGDDHTNRAAESWRCWSRPSI